MNQSLIVLTDSKSTPIQVNGFVAIGGEGSHWT